MTKDEALRLALEALEEASDKTEPESNEWCMCKICRAIDAIKAALEAKDEPVAWQYRDANDDGTWTAWNGCDKRLTESDWRKVRPLYTTPPQRKPLTDEQIEELWDSTSSYYNVCDFARAIEAAHGIKGEA